MNILSGSFDQLDRSPISTVSEGSAVFNNDRKIGLVEETVHSLQYALGSNRIPVLVKRPNGLLGLMV
jgi:hypothetical protein